MTNKTWKINNNQISDQSKITICGLEQSSVITDGRIWNRFQCYFSVQTRSTSYLHGKLEPLSYTPGSKFTGNLKTILREVWDLGCYDNWLTQKAFIIRKASSHLNDLGSHSSWWYHKTDGTKIASIVQKISRLMGGHKTNVKWRMWLHLDWAFNRKLQLCTVSTQVQTIIDFVSHRTAIRTSAADKYMHHHSSIINHHHCLACTISVHSSAGYQ